MILACGQKSQQLCCDDATFMAEECEPFQYCLIAVGTAQHGVPMVCPPPQTPGIPDAGECTTDASDLKDEMKQALDACERQLQPLYNLQKDLAQCVQEVDSEVKDLEQDKEKIGEVSKEGQECASKNEKAKSEAQVEKMTSYRTSACPSSFFVDAVRLWQRESTACIESRMAEFTGPNIDINIDVPKIDVSIDVPIPEIKVPAFDAPGFDSNIVIPGGGPKLNSYTTSASGNFKVIALETRMANVKADVEKCKDSKAKIPAAKERMQQSLSQATEQKTTMCKERRMTTPEAQATIRVWEAFREIPFFSCASSVSALDALISDLRVC